jgi:hypothetical protein
VAILQAMADGDHNGFYRRAIFACVPLPSRARACILKRPEASAAQHLSIAFSQGWMAIPLNLSRPDGTVPICIGEEEVFASANKTKRFLLFSPLGIFSQILPHIKPQLLLDGKKSFEE